jgi:hypothetical protein
MAMDRRMLLAAILTLTSGFLRLSPASAGTPARGSTAKADIVEKDPNNPKGLRIRRARRVGEDWTAYFCEVLLWPYTPEYYNHLFVTMKQQGRSLRFVPDVVFEVDEKWILVLQGDRATCALMGKQVSLKLVGAATSLRPTDLSCLECPHLDSWLGFVTFPKPRTSSRKVMSAFAPFGDAGGVADVLTEAQVRQRFKVLRDLEDVIVEDILPKQ